ncbi:MULTISPECIES: hypothetical protein [Pseudomonas]|jgi:hypothetical protein|uniref:Lipoprotein n=1 Tax=Pseudomonas fluorescens TaxID=294 RepID=A0A109KI64_PSEFL|nr:MULTISPECIES: hypothetical protein [Pseudomonas]KAA6196368.1 hypothetical protein F3K52_05315 [Pseudomonas lactis]KRC97677.1 hypothetical protein ASE33_03845 [Pseudomonas sp. Root9]KWV69683.1 hypothetical protein PFL603g_06388 [Pseudomonas fluorescens]
MKRLVVVGMFGFLISGCGNSDINVAREEVKRNLNDSASAEFRGEKVYRLPDNTVVCGEVNAKNSYGGYAGFSKYVVEGVGTRPVAKFGEGMQTDISITCQFAETNSKLKQ